MPSSLEQLAKAVLHVPRSPERVLEIGCGEGDGVLFLAREFPAARVRGTDRSGEAIRRAAARVGLDPEGRVAFKQFGGRSLPYPDAFFDLVVQRRGPPRVAEVARVLKPGGCLLQLEPPRQSLLARGPRALGRRLARAGLEIVGEERGNGPSFLVGRLSDD